MSDNRKSSRQQSSEKHTKSAGVTNSDKKARQSADADDRRAEGGSYSDKASSGRKIGR